MKKLWLMTGILIVILSGSQVWAQEEEEAFDILEITASGGLTVPASGISDWNDSLGASAGWNLGIGIGYFFKYNFVAGIEFTYAEMGVDNSGAADGTAHRLYNPSLYAKYYFIGESNFEPYVKAHFGLENAKFTAPREEPYRHLRAISYDPAIAGGIGLGLFYYSADYSGLFLEAEYHYAKTADVKREYDNETLTFGEDLSTLNFRLGIRVLVGSDE